MPFGGSGLNYTLSYTVQVIGGPAAGGQITGVSQAIDKVDASNKKATASSNQFAQGQKGAETAVQSHNKALKGLVFGITGMISSGVEAIGMFGMYTDAQERMNDATARVEEATKKYGETSKQARDATSEQEKAERALNMVRRNTILSGFDMLTWITLTVTQLKKMDLSLSSVTGIFSKLGNAIRGVSSGAGTGISSISTQMTNLEKAVKTSATPMGQLSVATQSLSKNARMAATSVTPLGGAIAATAVAEKGAIVQTNLFGRALQFLKMNIRGLLIGTGIGAAVVAIGFLVEHFMNLADASGQASQATAESSAELKNSIGSWGDITQIAMGDVNTALDSGSKDMDDYTKGVVENIQHQVQEWHKLPQEVALSLAEKRKVELTDMLKTEQARPKKGEIGTQSLMDVFTGKKSLFEPTKDDAKINNLIAAIKGVDANIATLKKNVADAKVVINALGQTSGTTGAVLANTLNVNLQAVGQGAAAFKSSLTDLNTAMSHLSASSAPAVFAALEASLESMADSLKLQGTARETFINLWKDWIDKAKDEIKTNTDVAASQKKVTLTVEEQLNAAKNHQKIIDLRNKAAEESIQKQLDEAKASDTYRKTVDANNEAIIQGELDKAKAHQQYKDMVEKNSSIIIQKQLDEAKAHQDYVDLVNKNNDKLIQEQLDAAKVSDKIKKQREANAIAIFTSENKLIASANESLRQHASELGMTDKELEKFGITAKSTASQVQENNNALSEQVIQLQHNNNMFQLSTNLMVNYNLAYAKGVQAAGEWVLSIRQAEVESNGFLAELESLARAGDTNARMFFDLTRGVRMSSKELQQTAQSTKDFESGVAAIADVINSKAGPALTHFADLISEIDKKAFKKGKKEKSKLMEQLGFDDKTIDQAMKGVDKLHKISMSIETIGVGLENMTLLKKGGGKNVGKAIAENIETIKDAWDDLKKADEDLSHVHGYRDLLDQAATGSPEAISKLQLFNAQLKIFQENDGDISPDEANFLNNILQTGDAAVDTTDALKPLSAEQQKIADNNTLARTINQVTTNFNLQGRAVRGLTADMNQLVNVSNKYPGGGIGGPSWMRDYSMLRLSANTNDQEQGDFNKVDTKKVDTKMTDDMVIIGKAMQALEVAAQKLQTGLANLANQGSNSFGILAKNSSTAMSGMSKNLTVGEVAAQKLQTGIANLANQGANSYSILAKASSKNMSGMGNNLKKGEVAAQHLQTGIANLAKQGSNSYSILAKSSSTQMNGMIKNLKKGEVGAQQLQKGLANLSNQGSNSLMALAKASSKAMNGMINNFNKGISAAHALTRAINSIPSGGGGGTFHAQHGLHRTLQDDAVIFAHKGERVDIGPDHGTSTGLLGARYGGDSGGDTYVTLKLSGNDIINDKKLVRKITTTVGQNRDRFG